MKNKKHNHLTKTERLEIALLKEKKYSIRNIAKMPKRSPNSISMKTALNKVNGACDPLKANHKACVKRKYSKYQGMKVVDDWELRNYVEEKIKQSWSPEQISGRIKNYDRHIKYVGFKGIYKFIDSSYGRTTERYLRYKVRKKKEGNGTNRLWLAKPTTNLSQPQISFYYILYSNSIFSFIILIISFTTIFPPKYCK